MNSCQLLFPRVRSSLVFSGFGLKPPASGFQSYYYRASSLLHLYITNGKTPRLMMKSFSTVRDTQRGTQNYMEKRRGGDRGDQEEKRGNQKGREQASQ